MKKCIMITAATIAAGMAMVGTKAEASEIWGIGDSTSFGWDGHKNVTPWINTTAKDLGVYSNNWHAHSGYSIQSNFAGMVSEFNGDKYHTRANYIVVNLGVNDVNYGTTNINDVMETYRARLMDLKAKNPQATIYLMLSQGDWLNGNNNTIHQGGYSMNQLRNAIKQLGRDANMTVIDTGIVNDSNHAWKLGDGTVHPTAGTYVEIGHKVAQVIKANPNNNSRYTASVYNRLLTTGYVNTMAGYRWLENGKAYTGIRNYMGAYYYFINGVRKNNQWVNMWGNRYYAGFDGRFYQGTHVIGGKTYNFGNDNTYYVR